MIKYPTFTKVYAIDNSETTINVRISAMCQQSSIYMHAINDLTNQSIIDINKLYNAKIKETYPDQSSIVQSIVGQLLQNPTIIVKLTFTRSDSTGAQYVKEFDASNIIEKSVANKILFANLRDSSGQGIDWEAFNAVNSGDTIMKISIIMKDSIKYKTKKLSVFIKETSQIEII